MTVRTAMLPDEQDQGQNSAEATSSDNVPPGSLRSDDEKEKAVQDAAAEEKPQLSRLARILILGPVTLTYFLWFLDLAVVSTATPAITSEFNSLVDVGWLVFRQDLLSIDPLLILKRQVWWSISAGLFRSHSTDWQALSFVLNQGKFSDHHCRYIHCNHLEYYDQ